ncbi:putative resolvase/recombinase [Selenomonas ruminantium subsp. lactilytica TAM6421]|uniref:Putative resolvase/recombinase n=1 Tax=Selenomonas ruminantium subsp. lactilytica (strain NBRC 103574 / TAM6421) TaxID=927704 RepID=I0GUE7_SELRL|nr:recombinase family protein [Selenomonas ruminantium]BAL84384.1 putative resolvase/recombinase [Selenomonas ruminantium subsp. lactilytica TAM6421]
MAAKVYGYAENEADVAELRSFAGVDVILEDMAERGQYRMLRRFLREGDTLMVAHLSALGDSDRAVREEVDYLVQHQIRLQVLELPVTLQDLDEVSAVVVYQTLKDVLQVYQQRDDDRQALRSVRQQEGIQAARKAGRRFGRPAIAYPQGWKHIWKEWQAREISVMEACRKLKMSRSTFYRMAKRYQQGEKGGPEECLS